MVALALLAACHHDDTIEVPPPDDTISCEQAPYLLGSWQPSDGQASWLVDRLEGEPPVIEGGAWLFLTDGVSAISHVQGGGVALKPADTVGCDRIVLVPDARLRITNSCATADAKYGMLLDQAADLHDVSVRDEISSELCGNGGSSVDIVSDRRDLQATADFDALAELVKVYPYADVALTGSATAELYGLDVYLLGPTSGDVP